MNTPTGMPGIDAEVPENAVSVYGQSDAYEDFPVLKAFQQYIDSEQAKARKRLILLCAFFGILMFVVMSVFVLLLVNVSSRNQALNDRLVEFAMNDRAQRGSAVVVQPAQDNSALLNLTAKLDEMQKKLSESQSKAEKIAAETAGHEKQVQAETKGPTKEELEIARLKALLATEREKQAVEREKQRQIELEAYRRQHYPELYGLSKPEKKETRKPAEGQRKTNSDAHKDLLQEVDEILKESEAVTYFDDDDADGQMKASAAKPLTAAVPPSPATPPPAPKEYSIPVDIRGSSSRWNVPND